MPQSVHQCRLLRPSWYCSGQCWAIAQRPWSQVKIVKKSTILFILTGLTTGTARLPASAQLIPDNTLGIESSVVMPNVPIRGEVGQRIERGAMRGRALFHSFDQFNLGEGDRVYFANPAGIETILSRVTGGDRSRIFGTLGVDGPADLFLLNPNGIVFGSNARLDIAGTFGASTGDRFTFADGQYFSATHPNLPPLLTVDLTPGIQWGQGRSPLISESQLITGQDLVLHGGEVNLTGALRAGRDLVVEGDRVQIWDRVQVPFISESARDLTITGNSIDIFTLNHPNSGLIAGNDLVLRSPNPVIGDAHYWSGGDFRIEQVIPGSNPGADTIQGDLVSVNDPVIRAAGDVILNRYRGASLHILAGGSVELGEVLITGVDETATSLTETIPLQDGSTVKIDGSVRPTLDVRAGVDLAAIGLPEILGRVQSDLTVDLSDADFSNRADIRVGQVTINASPLPFLIPILIPGDIFLTNRYQPNGALPGTIAIDTILVEGGRVIVDARDDILLSTQGFDLDNRLSASGSIQTTTLADDPGTIRLLAQGAVTLAPDFLLLNTNRRDQARAGNLDIVAGSLVMEARSQIRSDTSATQDGGEIQIQVENGITLVGDVLEAPSESSDGRVNTVISSIVEGEATANGGDVTLIADSLIMTDGAAIATFVRSGGEGNAGNITIQTSGDIVIDGTEISRSRPRTVTGIDARIPQGATGRGGDITIAAHNLTIDAAGFPAIRTDLNGEGRSGDITIDLDNTLDLRNTSAIITNVREFGNGNAGNLTINAQRVRLDNNALISTVTAGNGSSGALTLNTGQLIVRNDSRIASVATASSTGAAGILTVVAPELVQFTGNPSSEFSTGLFSETLGIGRAGALTVISENLLLQDGAEISATTSGSGRAGNLTLQPPESRNQLAIAFQGDRSQITASTTDSGSGGLFQINVPDALSIQGEGTLAVRTTGSGPAGNFRVNAGTVALFDGVVMTAASRSTGRAGGIRLETEALTLRDRARIIVSSRGNSPAGRLEVEADRVALAGRSRLTATTEAGSGANITLRIADTLSLTDNSRISALTDDGVGGDLRIRGNLHPTEQVTLQSRSQITTEATGSGDGGSLIVEARNLFLDDDSVMTAATTSGSGGSVLIRDLDQLNLDNGSQMTARTQTGTAGNLAIAATEQVTLNHASQLSVEATAIVPPVGQANQIDQAGLTIGGLRDSQIQQADVQNRSIAGDLDLQVPTLEVLNGSSITVASPSGEAGTLTLRTRHLTLDQGIITAATGRSPANTFDAANISLSGVELLQLQNNSLISAEANGAANGGNVTIDMSDGFIIGDRQSNSDIIATAVTGDGGRIAIAAIQIFNLSTVDAPREQVLNNTSNNISASSEFGNPGTIAIDDFGLDPVQAAADLPTNTTPPPLSQGCQPGGDSSGRFVNIGRGGIPLTAADPIEGTDGWEDVMPPQLSAMVAFTDVTVAGSDWVQWRVSDRGQILLLTADKEEQGFCEERSIDITQN